jgi:hypothetical protein
MERPSSTRFPMFRSLAGVLFSRWTAAALLSGITLIALLYAVENFRGKRMWDRYRKDAEARGLQLNFAAHVPPPISDSENAASSPLIRSWFPKPRQPDPLWPDLHGRAQQQLERRKIRGRHLRDLVAWKEALARVEEADAKSKERVRERQRKPAERAEAAPAVLEALRVYEPALNELRAASRKPQVRYPVDYKTDQPFSILLPHLAKIKGAVQLLSLRSSAALAAGKPQEALDDVLLMVWLAESMRDEPFLINQLVRIACSQITMHVIWEGLAEHRWDDAQLKVLQERLSQIEFLSGLERCMRAEHAGGVAAIEWLRQRGRISDFTEVNENPGTYGQKETFADVITRSAPRGWFQMEAVNYGRLMDLQLEGVVDVQQRRVDATQAVENSRRLKGELKHGFAALQKHRVLASLLLPALGSTARKFAVAQTTTHQAVLACALERYRLLEGKLPENVNALLPRFLPAVPHDVLTGQPLAYEAVAEGDFTLTSVGWPGETGEDGLPREDRNPDEWIWVSRPR